MVQEPSWWTVATLLVLLAKCVGSDLCPGGVGGDGGVPGGDGFDQRHCQLGEEEKSSEEEPHHQGP